MATGCGSSSNEDNGGFDISSIDTSTLGGYLHAEFRTFLSENKDAEAENTRLRKENERIKMELEILKKAIAIFSQDQEM